MPGRRCTWPVPEAFVAAASGALPAASAAVAGALAGGEPGLPGRIGGMAEVKG